MRTLLRNRSTHLYLAAASGWTSSLDSALDFEQPGRASQFVHDAKLEEYDFEVILLFNNSRYGVVVPVDGYGTDR
jgi:hypothetical protein